MDMTINMRWSRSCSSFAGGTARVSGHTAGAGGFRRLVRADPGAGPGGRRHPAAVEGGRTAEAAAAVELPGHPDKRRGPAAPADPEAVLLQGGGGASWAKRLPGGADGDPARRWRPGRWRAALPEEETARFFTRPILVSPSRTELALAAARAGLEAKASLSAGRAVPLYVGIPFCPTRCAYCSFVSADVKRSLKLVPPFLEALDREIDEGGGAAAPGGRGGPHHLFRRRNAHHPERGTADHLMERLERRLDLSRLTEYTVEAGRPDTITADKMAVIAAHGGQGGCR